MSDLRRQEQIAEYLKSNRQATVEELAALLYVSAASVRRDLTELEKAGRVKRTHGGVIYSERSDETSIDLRQTENAVQKSATVAIAAKYLPDFQSAFIDNSSTCYMLADKLDLTNKTVVTNGLRLAMNLSRRGVNVVLLGGTLRGSSDSTVGAYTAEMLQRFKFDVSLTSCAAVDTSGTYEISLNTAIIKRSANDHALKKILLFDSIKPTRIATFCSYEISDYSIMVTDAPDKDIEPLRAATRAKVINR